MDKKTPPKSTKSVSRRKFLETSATLAAAMVMPGLMGCNSDTIEEFLQKHFVELSPVELENEDAQEGDPRPIVTAAFSP
ncbi:twin-arginine translocation signal domain-containing protein [Bdellovibrionota bacterium FG-2]